MNCTTKSGLKMTDKIDIETIRGQTVTNYNHDCERCIFLGVYSVITSQRVIVTDLYFCEAQARPTVIARYGDEGHQYHSGLEAADYQNTSPDLAEAKSRAIAVGLLKGEGDD